MKILVFQHVSIEHPGSFREIIRKAGHTMHAVELDEGEPIPDLAGYDIMLVMGGAMDVWEEDIHPWLKAEKTAIREWVSAGRPYLGMCLGEQLLAVAMGGSVQLMTAPPEVGMSEVSITPDPIFAGIGPLCTCFQWHGAEVVELPPGARLLATGPGCAVQAFAIGSHAYGLQFHLELTETTAAEWGALPAYAQALETVKGQGAMAALEAEVSQNLPALKSTAAILFSNFLKLAEAALRERASEQSFV
jgi:GMP synthase-like glutamine amidotransferase